jgi:hypothetical protein
MRDAPGVWVPDVVYQACPALSKRPLAALMLCQVMWSTLEPSPKDGAPRATQDENGIPWMYHSCSQWRRDFSASKRAVERNRDWLLAQHLIRTKKELLKRSTVTWYTVVFQGNTSS